jgi:tripartite-type tricarboxylate transporter receptor subunit TctC
MKLPHRRQFLHLAAGAAALPAVSRIARAQAYPTRPVRVIVGFAPGGGNDILARMIGQWLSERFGQQFIIENRPGAATNIATEIAVRAPGDGYTLLLVSPANAINATLYEKLNFNFIRDIAPVASLVRLPLVMVVNPSLPTKTYRGDAPALTDLLGGQVQVYFSGVAATLEHIRTGKLRPLAVTTASRSEALPDVPSVADFVPGYEASVLFGVGAPRNTPTEIVDKLNQEINAGLADPKIRARLADMGGAVLAGSPAEFSKLLADETEKWAKVVKFSGAKAD